MFASRYARFVFVCALLAVVFVGLGSVYGNRFVRPLNDDLLDRVRGRNNNSGSITMSLACAYSTFDSNTIVSCSGVSDGTSCGACTPAGYGRLAIVLGTQNNQNPIERSGGSYICSNLSQILGTCQSGSCTGQAGEDPCTGGYPSYVYED